jgi:mannose-6-phosphate isomerase-like protein (cupin superfamily)
MTMKSVHAIALVTAALAALTLSDRVTSQSVPPEKDRGVGRKELAVIDLASEIDGMTGRVLRQHRTTLEPGGAIRLHDHVDRPEILFVVTGRLTDHQGSESRDYGPGESYAVGKNNRHWLENRGTEPATFIGTSILKKP